SQAHLVSLVRGFSVRAWWHGSGSGVYGASGGARNGHTTLPEVALIEVRRTIPAGPDRVFAVLADGWMYAAWVVGAAHVRDVDPQWPAVGARIHHSLGPWPLMMHDVTKVLNVE